MRHRIAITLIVVLLIIAGVDFLALKALGLWGAIDSPVKALLLGVMLIFNIFALPVGIVFAILRLPTRANRGLCPRCAYDLRHQHHLGCPECGWNREPQR